MVSLDDALAQPSNGDDDADAGFRQEWVRSVFTMALDALRSEARDVGKEIHVQLFEAYDVADAPDDCRPSYRDLATQFDLPETTITNNLAWARRAFRRHVLDVLRSLAGSEAEFREDARDLLGDGAP
jgi:hypothetical protein